MELFYDLAFVVAIASTAHALSGSESPRAYLEFAVQFVLLQWAWTGYTFYNDRFDSDDLLHRISGLCQMFLVLLIATLHDWLTAEFRVFVVAYILLRAFTIGFNYYAGIRIPVARQTTRTLAIGYSVALLPLIAAVFVASPGLRFTLVATTAILQLVPPMLLPASRSKDLPLSVTHVPERLGLFVTLALGECFAGLVRIGSTEHRTLSFGLGCAIAIGIVFCIWWTYFACLSGGHLKDLGAKTRIWVYGHIPLTMSIVAFAVGLEGQVERILGPNEPNHRFLVFASWGILLLCLAKIKAVSGSTGLNRLDRGLIGILLTFGGLSIGLSYVAWDLNPLVNLTMLLAMGVTLVLVSIWRDIESNPPQSSQTI